MRAAVFLVVLAIHVALFLVFAMHPGPAPLDVDRLTPAIAFFVPREPKSLPAEYANSAPTTAHAGAKQWHRAPQTAEKPEAAVPPQTQPPDNSITPPAAPDWRREMEIAANNQLETVDRQRRQPSVLAPHDFSKVKPGSTDDSRPEFAWDHSATHRVEEMPNGGLLININDRCAIAWVILPFPFCRIGRIPVHGDLFDHMKETP
jgi:hypothetical protein